jgi:hypothetical protein
LNEVAYLAGWATCSANQYEGDPKATAKRRAKMRERHGNNGFGLTTANQAQLAVSGTPPTGSPAPTGKRGQLNPALSRWLMGFPPEWDACAVTATPVSRRSRRNS